MSETTFIIGPNGVGKSSVLLVLKDILDSAKYAIHDFDERGVPDEAGKEWRVRETNYWIRVGKDNNQSGKSTLICGFAKPKEITDGYAGLKAVLRIILLDASPETIRERIISRYQTPESRAELNRTTGKTVEKFIEGNIYYSSILRDDCRNRGYLIIGTDSLTPQQIAAKVFEVIS